MPVLLIIPIFNKTLENKRFIEDSYNTRKERHDRMVMPLFVRLFT